MQNLTAEDFHIALEDLLGSRLESFKLTQTYAIFGPILANQLKAWDEIPDALEESHPNAKPLKETDKNHDGYGMATFYMAMAVVVHPKASQAQKAQAQKIIGTFIPRLGLLKGKYIDEVIAAKNNRPKLNALEAELKTFKTPLGDSVYDWLNDFITAGEQIGELLSDRAMTKAAADGASAIRTWRTSTLSHLNTTRATVEAEVENNPNLPRNLSKRIFGYFDLLHDFRSRNPVDKVPPPPPPPSTFEG